MAILGSCLLLAGQPASAGSNHDRNDSNHDTNIVVTHAAGAGSTTCLPAAFAASATVNVRPTTYTVVINARAPICEAVTAAIYSMPHDVFWPWPQHKVESQTFSVQPGTTTIEFTRGCAPEQFDVITGDSPMSIQPGTGPMHGPILFWFPWTGYQNWDGPCGPASTTTSTPTTSSTSTSTSVTVPVTVAAATTLPTIPSSTTTSSAPAVVASATTSTPASVASATTVKPVVKGATLARTDSSGTVAERLAATGITLLPLLLVGLGLLLAGAAIVIPARRHRT